MSETASDVDFPEPVAVYLRLQFPDPNADRPYIILNMISSADGKAVAGDTEALLSSPTDKLTLQCLRAHADCVLNGAGTARASGLNPSIRNPRLREWRSGQGRPDPPMQAVLAGSGKLPADAAFLRSSTFKTVVFVTEKADPAALEALRQTPAAVEVLPEGQDLVGELLRRLRSTYGVRLLLLEGGPRLNWAFFQAACIDDFFLTLSPRIAGGQPSVIVVEGGLFPKDQLPELELVTAFRTSRRQRYFYTGVCVGAEEKDPLR